MFFKLKNVFHVQVCIFFVLFSFSAHAENPFLRTPVSTAAALSNAGAAAPGDASMVDINPALLPALKKQYTIFGNTSWQNNFNFFEAGILDTSTSAFPAVLRARETVTTPTLTRDRRFTLGLSYLIPETHLSFGLSGDYELISMSTNTQYTSVNSFMGAGVLYQLPIRMPLFIGASATGIFDRIDATVFDLGLSTTVWDGFYTFNMDFLSNSMTGVQSFVTGVNVAANQFLDVRGSLGFDPKSSNLFWGSGIFFNAPVIHIFYTISLFDTNAPYLTQTAGLSLVF